MTTYIRQDFLRMEDELDEFFYSKEKHTKEEIIDLLLQAGVEDTEKQEFYADLYARNRMTQLLDNIIFNRLKETAIFQLGNGSKQTLKEMGFLNFARQVHNNKYNTKVLHIIQQMPKKKGE